MRWLGALRSDTPGAAWAGDRTHRTDSFLQHIRRGALVYATVLADRELMCENYPEDQYDSNGEPECLGNVHQLECEPKRLLG